MKATNSEADCKRSGLTQNTVATSQQQMNIASRESGFPAVKGSQASRDASGIKFPSIRSSRLIRNRNFSTMAPNDHGSSGDYNALPVFGQQRNNSITIENPPIMELPQGLSAMSEAARVKRNSQLGSSSFHARSKSI